MPVFISLLRVDDSEFVLLRIAQCKPIESSQQLVFGHIPNVPST